MDADDFLRHLQRLPWYQGQAAHVHTVPARPAAFAAPPAPLAATTLAALRARGAASLFAHQAEAIAHLTQGRDTVISTPTASGKSLCYVVPILEALAADPGACALLMFPTKALAQDQLRALRALCAAAFGAAAPRVDIYDGDTPADEREEIREHAQLLITNPDMLHVSILPVHPRFARLLSNLRFVVVDEVGACRGSRGGVSLLCPRLPFTFAGMERRGCAQGAAYRSPLTLCAFWSLSLQAHTYRGVFGSHAALVLRRLRRLCARVYGAAPTFAVTTATVANPGEHACALLGVPRVELVTRDGSPAGPKSFVLWNPPPLLDPAAGGGGGGGGGSGGGARARQEAARDATRRARQERGCGAHLGGVGGVEEGAWVEAVRGGGMAPARGAPGPRAPGADAAPQAETSPPPAPLPPPPLTAAERRLAAAAAAAISAAAGTSIAAAALPAPVDIDHLQRPRPLRQIAAPSVGSAPAPQTQQSMRARTARGGGAAALANDDPVAAAQARLPSSREWRARYGAAGVAPAARRSSPIVEVALLLAECCQHGVRAIAFCGTRKLCELVCGEQGCTGCWKQQRTVRKPSLCLRIAASTL
jgi:DEAD/DEAH box helicase domain-containing protein